MQQRQGFNLVEAALVLGVAGLVIGGIWVAASAVSENMKVNATVTTLMAAADAWNRLETKPSAYLADETSLSNFMIGLGVFPANLANPFGGSWGAYAESDFGGQSLKILITGLSRSACIKVASQTAGHAGLRNRIDRASAASGTGYVNSNIAGPYSGWASVAFPLDLSAITSMCAGATPLTFLIQFNPSR